jgi:hypothetical protein
MASTHDQALTEALIRDAFVSIRRIRAEYIANVIEINADETLEADERIEQRAAALVDAESQTNTIAEETGEQIAAYLRFETAD